MGWDNPTSVPRPRVASCAMPERICDLLFPTAAWPPRLPSRRGLGHHVHGAFPSRQTLSGIAPRARTSSSRGTRTIRSPSAHPALDGSRGATDQGFPLRGEWRFTFGERKPHVESGVRCWRTEDPPVLKLRLAYAGPGTTVRVFWKRLGDEGFDDQRSLPLPLNPDGKFHTYQLNLNGSPSYSGLLTGLAADPLVQPEAGGTIGIQAIELVSPR
jgi:hypothetical protein